jgi:hypothetical protein
MITSLIMKSLDLKNLGSFIVDALVRFNITLFLTYSVFHLLPFQTVRFVYSAITGAPQLYSLAWELWEERKRRIQEEEEQANMESSEEEEPKEKKPRR